jgi:hypothetical protein
MRAFYSLATLALAAGTAFGATVAACSSDNSNQTPPVFGEDAGDATTPVNTDAGTDTGPATDDGGGSSETSTGSDGSVAATDAGDSGTGADTAAPGCTSVLSDAGCWTCPSASDGSVEFLNQCSGTGVHCVPFDNLAKLPGYDAGLPPLN